MTKIKLTQLEEQRYARQLSVPEIGIEGQLKLKKAAVLIIGCGGLGSSIALYLAGAGVGRIGLVDHDVVALSDLSRQVAYSTDLIEKPKVVALREHTIEEAWNSWAVDQFRAILQNNCPDCARKTNCMGGCPLVPEIVLCREINNGNYGGK